MQRNKETMMFCQEGKCVDVLIAKCSVEFEDINNQIECEEMKKNY